MPYVPGGDCNIGTVSCDGCFPSGSKSPVVVKILRPINRNAGRFSNRGMCCNCRMNKHHANQMVCNQNKIVNFDLINRINEANGICPIPTYTSTPPGGPPGKRNCDNCLRILRDKELQLLKKEQEILKIKTHFTNLPKRGNAQDGLGTNCEHCFRALREKEFELFRKEQEIAKMRRAALGKSPIDTQGKVDRARCANCFKALRLKEIELIKKEHALMKNMTRPNINVKNLNFCSCCRDNKKSPLKKQEELRNMNRDNCFKQLRMKEIRLLAKEKEIDKKIQQFREESIAKAKMDLEKTPDPRLIKPTTQEVIKCVCSCTGLPPQVKEKPKGVCALFYKKRPPTLAGLRGQTAMVMHQVDSKDSKLSSIARKKRKCTGPCCVMKLAANMAQCFLTPPNAKKPRGLSEACKFIRMVPWCDPCRPKKIVKCCIEPIIPAEELPPEEQKRIQKHIKKQKYVAIKAAKAVAKSAPGYKVDTIGQIRPMSKPPSGEKLNVLEAEVLRSCGPRGLKTYMTKMAALKVDTEVAHAKLPKRDSSSFLKEGQYKPSLKKMPSKFSCKATKQFLSKMRIQVRKPKESKDLYSADMLGAKREVEMPSAPSPKIIEGTFKTKLYDRATRAAKQFKTKGRPDYIKTKIEETKNYAQTPDTARSTADSKTKELKTSQIIADDDEDKRVGVTKKYNTIFSYAKDRVTSKNKTKALGDEASVKVPNKYDTKIDDDDRTEVFRKFRAKLDDGDKSTIFRKPKAKIKDDDRTEISRKFRTKVDDDDITPVSRKFKDKIFARPRISDNDDDDNRTPTSRKFRDNVDDFDRPKVCVCTKSIAKIDDGDRTHEGIGRDKQYARKHDYERLSEDEDRLPRKYKEKGRYDYERNLPKRYRTKVDDEYQVPRGYGSQDYSEWGSEEKNRGPMPSGMPPCPQILKLFGKSLVYCAGCCVGIPCILFLCLCFLMSTCSD